MNACHAKNLNEARKTIALVFDIMLNCKLLLLLLLLLWPKITDKVRTQPR
jgi:hypothetical protein